MAEQTPEAASNEVPAPFAMLGVAVGSKYRIGSAVVEVVGFDGMYTALVRGGVGMVRVPLESFL